MTRFQEECEAALRRYLSSQGLEFRDRRVVGRDENYVHGFIGNTEAEVFIYLDQFELQSRNGHLNLEQWDAKTPADLIEAFIEAVTKLLTGSA